MAKAKGENVLIIGEGGKALAVGTSKGRLGLVSAAKLSPDLVELIRRRQELGKEITDALAKARYPVEIRSVTQVFDPSGVVAKLAGGRKKPR